MLPLTNVKAEKFHVKAERRRKKYFYIDIQFGFWHTRIHIQPDLPRILQPEPVAIVDAIAAGTLDLARKAAGAQIVHANRCLFLKILGAS